METSHLIFPLIAGFVLDALLGDPYWMPHPIRLFGNMISFFEKRFNKGVHKTLKGALVAIFLVSLAGIFFWWLMNEIAPVPYFFYPIATLLVYFGLANRCLINEVLLVNQKLQSEGLEAGRKQLSFIVGRETTHLTENQIRTAALETLAENLSDGVIAPLFYYAIGGIPLMFAYKMTNTLDSMIGYKSVRHKRFGYFAARLDDLLNLIPARLSALLMVLLTLNWRGFTYLFKYGHKHSSPNSGYPESALAGILNCRFGGPNTYHGQLVQKPYIGDNEREITTKDVRKATLLNFVTSLFFTVVIILAYILINK